MGHGAAAGGCFNAGFAASPWLREVCCEKEWAGFRRAQAPRGKRAGPFCWPAEGKLDANPPTRETSAWEPSKDSRAPMSTKIRLGTGVPHGLLFWREIFMMIRRNWPDCCYDRITEMASNLGRKQESPAASPRAFGSGAPEGRPFFCHDRDRNLASLPRRVHSGFQRRRASTSPKNAAPRLRVPPSSCPASGSTTSFQTAPAWAFTAKIP